MPREGLSLPIFSETPDIPKPGETVEVDLPDGSHIFLKKLDNNYDPTNKLEAIKMLESSKQEGKLVTGLIYVDTKSKDFNTSLNMTKTPITVVSIRSGTPTTFRVSLEKFTLSITRRSFRSDFRTIDLPSV